MIIRLYHLSSFLSIRAAGAFGQNTLNSDTEPKFKTPCHWAGFVLMGGPSPVYTSSVPVGIVGLVGGVLLLGGMLFWLKRKSKLAQQHSKKIQ